MPLDLTAYRIALAAQKAGDALTASADKCPASMKDAALACHAAARGWYAFGNALLEDVPPLASPYGPDSFSVAPRETGDTERDLNPAGWS